MPSSGRGIDLSVPLSSIAKAVLRARLEAGTKKVGDCWVWQGTKRSQNGHGGISVFGRPVHVHRLSYAIEFGPIPDDMKVCHQCDNPPCWRPEHLFLGTQGDNVHDAMEKGRATKPPVHRGAEHPKATLTDEQVTEIRARVGGQRDLATEYGCSQSTIWRIRHSITRAVPA